MAVSGFYLPVGYKSPEFSILANPSVPEVSTKGIFVSGPDCHELSLLVVDLPLKYLSFLPVSYMSLRLLSDK